MRFKTKIEDMETSFLVKLVLVALVVLIGIEIVLNVLAPVIKGILYVAALVLIGYVLVSYYK
jgi:hypothetical protein